jgi:hypothetical protein
MKNNSIWWVMLIAHLAALFSVVLAMIGGATSSWFLMGVASGIAGPALLTKLSFRPKSMADLNSGTCAENYLSAH